MRQILKSILAYAMGSRLDKLRNAVKAIQTQQAARQLLSSRFSSPRLSQGDSTINIPPPTV
jgi:hypothetical protein